MGKKGDQARASFGAAEAAVPDLMLRGGVAVHRDSGGQPSGNAAADLQGGAEAASAKADLADVDLVAAADALDAIPWFGLPSAT